MNIEVITLDENFELAQNIAHACDASIHLAKTQHFADGEVRISLDNYEQFTGKNVLLVQSTYRPVVHTILAVAFLAHELKNAGAQKIIGVVPYFGYSRQEASDIPSKPGNAAVVAQLFEGAGFDNLVTVELHTEKIINFFSIPVINLRLIETIVQHIKNNFDSLDGVCLVAPDKGAQSWVKTIAQQIGIGYFTFTKERLSADEVRITGRIGKCIGTKAIILDDIISTGGTALRACDELLKLGFKHVYGYFVHPVFARDARERIEKSLFKKIFVSNTIPLVEPAGGKVVVFDVTAALVASIKNI